MLTGQKRGEYLKFFKEEKVVIAKYTNEHSVAKAIRHFQGKNVKENSVRDWFCVIINIGTSIAE